MIHQQKVRRLLLEKELHGRSIDMNALLMDAQIVIKEGVCMRHGAKVKLCSIEGCTNQAQKGGVCEGAQTREEVHIDMNALPTDARIKLNEEECASNMEQRSNDAALKDAQMELRREEYAGGTGQIATPMMNLQLLHHFWIQNSTRLLQHLLLVSEIQQQSR